ncbi:extracellular solute-binding protein [Actinomadura rudentiformis]|uniref:Extracellular solute-binding protein n=1 Tax=Actinomadura rudentiformis TaxID=359158 RepID=A0A6H9YQ89_9ACTN|nr:extracellular solute-binding protein [Actinomadura rudentiformis]KAB2349567.1 extracellular solute-binding protein [Actinomadura rudentiformis]
MRRTPLAGIAACLAFALAACGGGGDKPQSGTSIDPATVSGTVTYWDTSDAAVEGPAFKELIAEFKAKHPKVTVNYINVPFGEAQNKFKTAAQSGSGAPDVLRTDVGWMTEFASLGYLAPLDGTYALDKPDDFLAAPAGSVKYNGKTWGVPQVTDSLGLLYNKDLLKKAGHDTPPKTIAELKQTALDVKSKTGKTGLTLNVDAYFLLPFIYGEGGDLVDAGSKKITINSPQSVAGLKVVEDLMTSGAAPKPAITDSYTAAITALKEGRTAMIYNGPWSATDALKGSAFKDKANLGVAPVPAGSAKAAAPTGGHDYTVYAGSKNLDASYAFVRFMASTESQAKIAGKLGLLPTRTSAYAVPEVKNSELVNTWKPIVDTAVPRAWIPEGGQLFEPLVQAYQGMVSGNTDAAGAAKTVDGKYRGLLKGWG